MLHGGCIFTSLRPWLYGCAAGSPLGSRMVTTSRNLIATGSQDFTNSKSLVGGSCDRPERQRHAVANLFILLFFALRFLSLFFHFFATTKKTFSKNSSKIHTNQKKYKFRNKSKKSKSKKKKEASKEGTPCSSPRRVKNIDFVLTNMLQEIVQQLRLAKTKNNTQSKKNTNIQKKTKKLKEKPQNPEP